MGKQEFLEKLRQALNGRVSADIVTENIRYYDEYITIEVRKGRSEEEILAQLGDPRLIARTIVQTHGDTGKGRAADESGNTRVYSERRTGGYTEDQGGKSFFGLRMPGWLLAIILLAVFTVIFVLALYVMSVALPILLIMFAVSVLVKLFRDWLN